MNAAVQRWGVVEVSNLVVGSTFSAESPSRETFLTQWCGCLTQAPAYCPDGIGPCTRFFSTYGPTNMNTERNICQTQFLWKNNPSTGEAVYTPAQRDVLYRNSVCARPGLSSLRECACMNRASDPDYKRLTMLLAEPINDGCWFLSCKGGDPGVYLPSDIDTVGCPRVLCQNILNAAQNSDLRIDAVNQMISCGNAGQNVGAACAGKTCSGHGTCQNGVCLCSESYGGDDCGSWRIGTLLIPPTWLLSAALFAILFVMQAFVLAIACK